MKPFLIGIAGGSGSGKSTVAHRVATALGEACAVTLDMDGYYRNLKLYADMILPRGGHNAVAIEMIVVKVRDRRTGRAS